MRKDEEFFPMKSDLESKLIDFINLCKEAERDVSGELGEALNNANAECGTNLDITIFDD